MDDCCVAVIYNKVVSDIYKVVSGSEKIVRLGEFIVNRGGAEHTNFAFENKNRYGYETNIIIPGHVGHDDCGNGCLL